LSNHPITARVTILPGSPAGTRDRLVRASTRALRLTFVDDAARLAVGAGQLAHQHQLDIRANADSQSQPLRGAVAHLLGAVGLPPDEEALAPAPTRQDHLVLAGEALEARQHDVDLRRIDGDPAHLEHVVAAPRDAGDARVGTAARARVGQKAGQVARSVP